MHRVAFGGSGGVEGAAADCPHEIVGHGVKQTGNAHLGEAAQDHMAKAAVLHAGMDMFGIAAPFVDGPAFFTVHASPPLLQALRFGGAIAFVSGLALWFGGILAGRRWAEHLHGGVGLRKRNERSLA